MNLTVEKKTTFLQTYSENLDLVEIKGNIGNKPKLKQNTHLRISNTMNNLIPLNCTLT